MYPPAFKFNYDYSLLNIFLNTCLIDGPDKCGKTVSMLQAIHYCLNAGWIVVHIPSGM